MKTFPTKGRGSMERFTFHKEYYDIIQRLKKPNDRALLTYAIIEFMFEGKEPENLSEVAEMAFHLLFPKIAKSKNNSGRGGRPKAINGCKTVLEIENRFETDIETDLKPIENRFEIKRETDPKQKERSKEKNNTLEREKIPPTPKGAGKTISRREVFFEKYPALSGRTVRDEGIDYDVLIREFELSTTLRGLYSFPKVVAMYTAIERGDFRDKQKPLAVSPSVDAANARAARERFYAVKQAQAESVAYGFQKTAKSNKRFVEIDRELSKLNLELAKAEVAGADLTVLREYQERLQEERRRILAKLGIEERQLLPKYVCDKCNDTGYMQDGRACDCYKP